MVVGILGTTAIGCPCTDNLINESPWLRWQIFATFGANKVCEEMTKRGALVAVDVPVPGFTKAWGRFYPQSCQSSLNNDTRTLKIWMGGSGYAWTPATQKMSFETSVEVEYKPDFRKDGDTTYVWFDVATQPPAPKFKITYVEQAATNVALKLYPVEWFATQFAQSFVQTQLTKGFTVIRSSDGDDFSLGKLAMGQRPLHPFQAKGKDRFTFANETSEIRGQQQDFLGPFEIDGDDRALFVKAQVQGPPVDVFVVGKDGGYQWRMKYQTTSPAPPPPPGTPILQQAVTPATGMFEGWVPLNKGLYYVVIDNSSFAGTLRPAAKLPTPFDPSAAQTVTVSYLVQVGDKP
jgi:hypothetical protein